MHTARYAVAVCISVLMVIVSAFHDNEHLGPLGHSDQDTSQSQLND